MTNLDPNPELIDFNAPNNSAGLSAGFEEKRGTDYIVEVLEPRGVPLGGPRAMTVQRTIPQRARSLIGAWCFLDYFGPDDVTQSGGMQVPRHPHTGLATVSWLFEGRVDHVDSAGNWALVRPGEVNLMNAGYGITHSEHSSHDTTTLHGVQLWYAFPEQHRFVEPHLDQHRAEVVRGPGWETKIAIGSLLGVTSPVETYSPLSAAEISLEPNTTLEIDVPAEHEHGLLAVECTANFNGALIEQNHLGYLGTGVTKLELSSGETPIRVMLIGGEPLHEDIVMWWNFVGRSHDEIARWRQRYQTEMGFEAPAEDSPLAGHELEAPVAGPLLDTLIPNAYPEGTRFPQYGQFPPNEPAPLPAPGLPTVAMKPRKNPPTVARRKED
ncbi:pirin family protein [Yaniella halotolerans]|uniref:pirin family protein n=1 Tax=Yaniella halotolerans TaxID=225453 RepID=UPI0003B79BED|nr:pirin family protein [Yaniella halotolerans]